MTRGDLTWFTVEHHTLRGTNTDFLIQLWVCERQLNSFLNFLDLNMSAVDAVGREGVCKSVCVGERERKEKKFHRE